MNNTPMTSDSRPTTNDSPQSDEIEINIADIIDFVKQNWKKALIAGIALGLVGVVYALLAQEEYESKTTLMPELQSSSSLGKMGGLGALAGLAGIDLSSMSSTEAVRPDLYPNIIQSGPFVLYLLEQPMYSDKFKKTMSLDQFFIRKNKTILSGLFNEDSTKSFMFDPANISKTLELDKRKEVLIKELNERLTAQIDKKSGLITIISKMPDPVVAASTVKIAAEYLRTYVTNYRTDKSRKQVKFLSNQVAEAKSRYQSAEVALAGYKDRNRFLIMNSAKVEEQRLISDFMLAQQVFNDLSKQYEQAKIRVEEETPVLKILEPAKVPKRRSEPKRSMIVVGFGVLGVFLYLGFVLAKQMFGKYI
jgi:uncharacterized protein involved in exopolysaccharide biosynthesis